MLKKFLSAAIAASLVATVFTGCSSKQETAPQTKTESGKQIVLRLAENQAADYPTTIGDKEFARLVEERTNGRIKIEVYHGGQLGQEKAVGAIQIADGAGRLGQYVKRRACLDMCHGPDCGLSFQEIRHPLRRESVHPRGIMRPDGLTRQDEPPGRTLFAGVRRFGAYTFIHDQPSGGMGPCLKPARRGGTLP